MLIIAARNLKKMLVCMEPKTLNSFCFDAHIEYI